VSGRRSICEVRHKTGFPGYWLGRGTGTRRVTYNVTCGLHWSSVEHVNVGKFTVIVEELSR
jgi:hypothetical protein